MNNLSLQLTKHILSKINNNFSTSKFEINDFIDVEDDEKNKYKIGINKGMYKQNNDILNIFYLYIPETYGGDYFISLFKKNNNPLFVLKADLICESDENFKFIKFTENNWIDVSLKEQLKLALAFEELDDCGLMMEQSFEKINYDIIYEVL